MKFYIVILLCISQWSILNTSMAAGITDLSNFTIQLSPGALGTALVDGENIPFKEITPPFCLAYDKRETISSSVMNPSYTNPSPLPKMTITSCAGGIAAQNYNYSNNQIKNNGLCLTRVNNTIALNSRIEDDLADRRECKVDIVIDINTGAIEPVNDYVFGEVTRRVILSEIALQACNGSADQNWEIDINADGRHQITTGTGGNCLSLRGNPGFSLRYVAGEGKRAFCPIFIVTNPSISIYTNTFLMRMGDCAIESSKFINDSTLPTDPISGENPPPAPPVNNGNSATVILIPL